MFAAPAPLYVQGIIALIILIGSTPSRLNFILKKLNEMFVDNHVVFFDTLNSLF
ncbi:MAG: hypothetical protein ACJAXM_000857 [Arenicella sp.]|jgi:hypothetical protein